MCVYLIYIKIWGWGDGLLAEVLVALAEEMGSVPSTHMVAHNHPYSWHQLYEVQHSYEFHEHQACMWCTNMHAGKTHTKDLFYLYGCFACTYVSIQHVCGASRDPKRALDHLELVMNCHVGGRI